VQTRLAFLTSSVTACFDKSKHYGVWGMRYRKTEMTHSKEIRRGKKERGEE